MLPVTEADWLGCKDLWAALRQLEQLLVTRQARTRKLRLFVCASCRRIWHLLTDGRSRTALQVAEQYADGLVTRQELETANAGAEGADDDADELVEMQEAQQEGRPARSRSERAAIEFG